jgi:hypothetical protein
MPPIAAQGTAKEHVHCLGTVTDVSVENAKGEELGTISGVAVNLPDAEVAYAIITVNHGLLGFDERHHGVAWDALRIDTKKKKVTIPIERSMLEDQPGIDMKALPSRPDLRVPAHQPVSLGEQ